VFPGRRLMPARTRVFLDALQAEFSGPRCQEQEALAKQARRGRSAAPRGHTEALKETPGRSQVSLTPSGGLTRSGRFGGAQ